MEEKAVCYYCATVYPADQAKCPLCGSTKRSEDYVIPQRRERMTEEERKRRQKGGKFAAQKTPEKKREKKPAGDRNSNINRKAFLVGALIFLILTVLVLFWFIADMIGWFPGLENTVERDTQVGVSVNVDCTRMTADPTRLSFDSPGQAKELVISVNATCEEKVYCTSNDPNIVTVSDDATTAEGTEMKSITFTINAVEEGSTAITVSCGNQTMGIPVTVTATQGGEAVTIPEDFVPELNWNAVEFTTMEESVTLKVANLPQGATVLWLSSDESVATVDAQGVVKPVSTGQVTITCDVDGHTTDITVRCDLGGGETTAANDEGAHLERGKEDVSVNVGDTFPLFLYNSDSEHIEGITYLVDDAAICEIVDDNYVKALSSGTTKVRVIYGDLEFICIVRVD